MAQNIMGGGWGTPGQKMPNAPYTSPGQQVAGQTFQDVGQSSIDWLNQAGANTASTGTAADMAYSQFQNTKPGANLGAWQPGQWSPTNLQGYSPSSLQSWLSNANMKPLQLGGYTSATASTSSYNPTDLLKFDPTAAMTTYATGAEQTFNKNLKETLRQLTNKSVGAGRINTGVFDEDQGRVVTQNAADFNSALAAQATALSGQKLGATTAADQILSSQSELNAQMATGVSEANAAGSLTARGQDITGYGAETARLGLGESAAATIDQLGLSRATAADQMGLTRATSLDTLGLTRANEADTLGLNKATTGMEAAIGRENAANSTFANAENAASGFATANLSNQNQVKQYSDLIAWMQKMGINAPGVPSSKVAAGGGGSGITPTDPYANYRALANALHVPFVGPTGG